MLHGLSKDDGCVAISRRQRTEKDEDTEERCKGAAGDHLTTVIQTTDLYGIGFGPIPLDLAHLKSIATAPADILFHTHPSRTSLFPSPPIAAEWYCVITLQKVIINKIK